MFLSPSSPRPITHLASTFYPLSTGEMFASVSSAPSPPWVLTLATASKFSGTPLLSLKGKNRWGDLAWMRLMDRHDSMMFDITINRTVSQLIQGLQIELLHGLGPRRIDTKDVHLDFAHGVGAMTPTTLALPVQGAPTVSLCQLSAWHAFNLTAQ